MPASDDLQKELAKARAAMENPAQKEKREALMKDIEAKRELARLAMEGSERRQKREAKEKEEKEKAEMRRKIDEEVKRRKEQAEKEAEEKAAKEKAELEAEEKAKQERLNRLSSARSVIEELKKETGSDLAPIRTLKTDSARAIQAEQMSAASMAMKQQQQNALRTATQESSGRKIGKTFIFIFILILISASAGLFYWTYVQKDVSERPVPTVAINSIVFADKNAELNTTTTPDPNDILEQIQNIYSGTNATDTITNIYSTKVLPAAGDAPEQKAVLNLNGFIKASGVAIPDKISRFVNQYMLGVYHGVAKNSAFYIFKINSFEYVSAAMIEGEDGYVKNIFNDIVGSDIEQKSPQENFKDRIIENKDTRVLLDQNGKIILLYSFIDTGTLVITESDESFIKIYNLLNSIKPEI